MLQRSDCCLASHYIHQQTCDATIAFTLMTTISARSKLIRAHLLGRTRLSASEQLQVDLDGDGMLTVADLVLSTRLGSGITWSSAPAATLSRDAVNAGDHVDVTFHKEALVEGAVVECGGARTRVLLSASSGGCTVLIPELPNPSGVAMPARLWLLYRDHRPRAFSLTVELGLAGGVNTK
jgi:hypothetical protein